jgi:ribokinase
MDAVYFTAGDAGAMRAARAARLLVATPRALRALAAGVALDALVSSAQDEVERRAAERVRAKARLIVRTEGSRGGSYSEQGRAGCQRWHPGPAQAPPVDSYGCGDSFAAGLAYALARGAGVADAVALGARCGATCLTGRGPYERQLSRSELG